VFIAAGAAVLALILIVPLRRYSDRNKEERAAAA
jgi:hypothetical protein